MDATFNEKEVEELLASMNGWLSEDIAISKKFEFNDFKEALAFVNKVGDIAERFGHHPDMLIMYNVVQVKLWTHHAGGVTKKDFEVAEQIEKVH